MNRLALAGLLAMLLLAGCQHTSLRNHTERQARTLTDLQYDQVLANMAMFADSPNTLPFFSSAMTGQTSNNYTVNPTSGLTWALNSFNSGPPLFFFNQAQAGLAGTFTANEQWGTNSVLNPDELLLMRCIYQKVLGQPVCDCDCDKKLQAFFGPQSCYLEAMRPGWYGIGRRHDVPKCAVRVQHCKDTYVWVTPEGVDYLTRVTLAILDLATAATPLVIPDELTNKINHLTAQAKDLSLILSQYPPLKTAEIPTAGYTNTKAQLDLTMAALAAALEQQAANEQIPSAHKITRAVERLPANLNPATRQAVENLLRSPTTPTSDVLFRARKQQFGFTQPVLGPTFLPGR